MAAPVSAAVLILAGQLYSGAPEFAGEAGDQLLTVTVAVFCQVPQVKTEALAWIQLPVWVKLALVLLAALVQQESASPNIVGEVLKLGQLESKGTSVPREEDTTH